MSGQKKDIQIGMFSAPTGIGGDIGSLGPVGRHPSGRVSPSSPEAGLDLERGEDLPS